MNFFKKFNKLKIKNESDKRRIITFGATIIGILIVLTGTSAAYLINKAEGKNNKIVAGELVLSLSGEETSLNLAGAVPMSDEDGLKQETVHNFSLENTGDVNAYYEIRLLNDCTVGSAITIGNESVTPDVCIPDNYVKVGIKKDDGNYSVKTIGVNGVVFSGNIAKGETLNFSLKLWLDYNTPNDYQGITQAGVLRNVIYNGQISLYMRQLPTNNIYTGIVQPNLANTWKDKTANELNYLAIYTHNQKDLPSTYEYDNETYTLNTTIDVSEQENNSVFLGEYTNGDKMIAIIGQDGGVVAPTDSLELFGILSNVRTINLSSLDTSEVTYMTSMFSGCSSLTSLDLSNFDTSNVTHMVSMFYNCSSLTSLKLNSFDTSNVINMYTMFLGCSSLTSLDLSSFNTSKVTDMSSMFSNCSSLTSLELNSFNTSKVTDMRYMFSNCSSLTSITVGCNWVIGTSTNTTDMFTSAGVSAVTKVCNE